MNRTIGRFVPFVLALIIVILVNAASTTLFFRADLTRDRVYSLSDASRTTVATLEEPMTVKAFFSPNLPAPYNNVAQTVRDLLEEYTIAGNRFFNYTITTVPPPERAERGEISAEEDEARKYRIFPVQVQNVQQDEVKLQTVYMALAFIHGDMLETIPALTNVDNLEYQVTTIMNGMSNKISALLSLDRNIEVTLFLTPNLNALGGGIGTLPETLRETVRELSDEYYGRLAFSHRNPFETGDAEALAREYGFPPLTLRTRTENGEVAESAYAALTVSLNDRSYTVDLIRRGVFGLQIADAESLKRTIQDTADSLIGIHEEIAFMTGFGTPPLGLQAQQQSAQSFGPDLTNFERLVSETYSIREVPLQTEPIPEGLSSLIVAGPTEQLSEYALFQIDQFLLRGGALVVYLDSHQAVATQQSQFGGAQETYVPLQTGLDALLRHYGLDLRPSYVMDEESFTQRQRDPSGGIVEIPIYFAPIVQRERVSDELPFTKNIQNLVLLNVSPFVHDPTAPGAGPDVAVTTVLRSSSRSWTVSENINLSNPYAIMPPPGDQRGSHPLALLAEGTFRSYFADRPVPEPPTGTGGEETAPGVISPDTVSLQQDVKREGTGRIFVMGSSAALGSNVLDAEGLSENSLFLLNLLDFMNGRTDYALMRTKGIGYAPLQDTTPAARSFIKTFNIAGLAILVAAAGLIVWLARTSRKRRIQGHFGTSAERQGNEE